MNKKILLKQIQKQNPLWEADYNVKKILKKDKGIRLHTKQDGRIINIDISVNPLDYYNLEFHELTGEYNTEVETTEKENISFKKLDETIRNQLNRGD